MCHRVGIAGENRTNLNIRLNVGAKISGTLFEEDGVIKVTDSTRINLYRGDPCQPESVTYIDTWSGSYEIDALSPGTYYLKTSVAYYYDRWWSPSGDAQTCKDAQPITITGTGDILPATNFRLKPKGSISGQVYQLDGVTPVTGDVTVIAYRSDQPCGLYSFWRSAAVDDGYTLRGLDEGIYFIKAFPSYESGYIPGWWSAAGTVLTCQPAEGIAVAEGQAVSGIDFSLHQNGRISGTVLHYDGSVIDSDELYVEAYLGDSACTAEWYGLGGVSYTDGGYAIIAPESGTYYLQVYSAYGEGSSFAPVWWSEKGSAYDCNQAEGITVAMDQTISDRDFRLLAKEMTNMLAEAVDNLDLTILTGGGGSWSSQTGTAWFDGDAAEATATDGNATLMETTVQGPAALSFFWKASSEAGKDFLRFYRDGELLAAISGEADWQQRSFAVPAGLHAVGWEYAKDDQGAAGADRGWVDLIEICSGPCSVDKDGDDDADGVDLASFAEAYARDAGPLAPDQVSPADLDGNGVVDEEDIRIFSNFWGYGTR